MRNPTSILRAVALAMCLFGCDKPRASTSPPATSALPAIEAKSDPAMATAEEFRAWYDAKDRQTEADARAGTTRRFATEADARAFLFSLTPGGFRPRPEYFASLRVDAGDVEAFANRMAAYAKNHPAEVDARIEAHMKRLEPLLKAISANIQKQFPNAAADSVRLGRSNGLATRQKLDVAANVRRLRRLDEQSQSIRRRGLR